nr:uncharacterized protein LOC109416361 [Aedes albopictus]
MCISKRGESFKTKQRSQYEAYMNELQLNIQSNPKVFWNYVGKTRRDSGVPVNVTYKSMKADCAGQAAELFADYFNAVYSERSEIDVPVFSPCDERIPDITLSLDEVRKKIETLDGSKGCYIVFVFFLSISISGGAFDGVEDVVSPFGYRKGEGIDAGCGEVDWICNRDRERTDPIFESLRPIDGKISGAAAKSELIKSKLPNNVLSKIWKLSDYDQDGFLDIEEFALAMHLINVKMDGNELPVSLPSHLVPPSKRNGVAE